MLFIEPSFFLFLVAYLVLHFLLPLAQRIWLIIFGGAIFYAWWRPDHIWVPVFLTLVAYLGALWLSEAKHGYQRKQRLLLTLIVLFVPLAVVKYSYFILTQVAGLILDPRLLVSSPESVKWGLPLGISFITFTACAYIVDVYRGRFKVEKNAALLFGHILFFPHLIAGPILRPHELIPRLKNMRPAREASFMLGLLIFTVGLTKKVVFADQIAPAVERVYAADGPLNWLDFVTAFYGFAVQIYCDFSGYTDMAIGLALFIGMRLPNNFLRPYTATSIIQFWRRWHITLSHWLRDYLYIPLGGNRSGHLLQMRNMMITMLLGGLWHGASWTFVVWGGLHGLALSINHMFARKFQSVSIPNWLGVILTFHFVAFAWVFFRAPDLATVSRVVTGLATPDFFNLFEGLSRNAFPLALSVFFLVLHRLDRHARLRLVQSRHPVAIQLTILSLLWVLAIAVAQGSSAKFIYFDF